MMQYFRRSLMIRAIAPIAALMLAITVLAVAGVATMSTQDARESLVQRALSTLTILAGGAGEALWNLDTTAAEALLSALTDDPDYIGSVIRDQDGKVFVQHGFLSDPVPAGLVVRSGPVVRKEEGNRTTLGSIEIRLSPERSEQVIQRKALMIAGIGFLVLLAVCGLLVLLLRSVTGPIHTMTETMSALAQGDTAVEVPAADRLDEVGRMGKAVAVFKHNAVEMARMAAESEAVKQRAEAEKREDMLALADSFEGKVDVAAQAFKACADRIIATASTMGRRVGSSAERTMDATEATERTNRNVAELNTAVRQLAESVSDVGQQVGQSAEIASRAVEEARTTNQKVLSLSEAADKIGEVVQLIASIASQTNLLALNATIEAARAGEAGRGFAVVATEVKSLAGQTARATEEISTQVAGIQASTRQAVEAIVHITQIIERISDLAGVVSQSISRQGSATQDIRTVVDQVSQDAMLFHQRFGDVAKASASSYGSAIRVIWAAKDLTKPTETLVEELTDLLATLRTG